MNSTRDFMLRPDTAAALADAAAAVQRRVIALWHEAEPRIHNWEDAVRELDIDTLSAQDEFSALSAAVARVNTYQWHEEDKARDPSASDTVIAALKRSIDVSNARRVAEIERLDSLVRGELDRAGVPARADAVLSSETPGSMVDRISVLLLKIYHTEEERDRPGITAQTREKFADRLGILAEQLGDLRLCLGELLAGICTGTRRFKLYYQLKMYNDPETNPYLRK